MIRTDLTYEEALALPDPKNIWLNGTIVTVDTDPPKKVPDQVYQYQARLALEDAGLLAVVNTAVSNADNDMKTRFEKADIWYRHSSHVLSIASQLGWTSDQLDDLFIAAAKE